MRLHMRDLVACKSCHRAERAGLVGDDVLDLAGAETRHRLPPKTREIAIAGVRTDADAARAGLRRDLSHDVGIALMIPTCDVDSGGNTKHGFVFSQTFADVGVDID